VRENRTHGSEGGEGKSFPTPIRHLDRFVIPAKAGIQTLLPGLIEKLPE
jgi:hypothetical protein